MYLSNKEDVFLKSNGFIDVHDLFKHCLDRCERLFMCLVKSHFEVGVTKRRFNELLYEVRVLISRLICVFRSSSGFRQRLGNCGENGLCSGLGSFLSKFKVFIEYERDRNVDLRSFCFDMSNSIVSNRYSREYLLSCLFYWDLPSGLFCRFISSRLIYFEFKDEFCFCLQVRSKGVFLYSYQIYVKDKNICKESIFKNISKVLTEYKGEYECMIKYYYDFFHSLYVYSEYVFLCHQLFEYQEEYKFVVRFEKDKVLVSFWDIDYLQQVFYIVFENNQICIRSRNRLFIPSNISNFPFLSICSYSSLYTDNSSILSIFVDYRSGDYYRSLCIFFVDCVFYNRVLDIYYSFNKIKMITYIPSIHIEMVYLEKSSRLSYVLVDFLSIEKLILFIGHDNGHLYGSFHGYLFDYDFDDPLSISNCVFKTLCSISFGSYIFGHERFCLSGFVPMSPFIPVCVEYQYSFSPSFNVLYQSSYKYPKIDVMDMNNETYEYFQNIALSSMPLRYLWNYLGDAFAHLQSFCFLIGCENLLQKNGIRCVRTSDRLEISLSHSQHCYVKVNNSGWHLHFFIDSYFNHTSISKSIVIYRHSFGIRECEYFFEFLRILNKGIELYDHLLHSISYNSFIESYSVQGFFEIMANFSNCQFPHLYISLFEGLISNGQIYLNDYCLITDKLPKTQISISHSFPLQIHFSYITRSSTTSHDIVGFIEHSAYPLFTFLTIFSKYSNSWLLINSSSEFMFRGIYLGRYTIGFQFRTIQYFLIIVPPRYPNNILQIPIISVNNIQVIGRPLSTALFKSHISFIESALHQIEIFVSLVTIIEKHGFVYQSLDIQNRKCVFSQIIGNYNLSIHLFHSSLLVFCLNDDSINMSLQNIFKLEKSNTQYYDMNLSFLLRISTFNCSLFSFFIYFLSFMNTQYKQETEKEVALMHILNHSCFIEEDRSILFEINVQKKEPIIINIDSNQINVHNKDTGISVFNTHDFKSFSNTIDQLLFH